MNEQNEELLEAALKLAKLVRSLKPKGERFLEAVELVQTIEAHRPKAKRLEGWINLYNDSKPGGTIWPTQQDAEDYSVSEGARQVHIREVIPVEWKPWTVQTLLDFPHYQAIIDAHNAEMERVTK